MEEFVFGTKEKEAALLPTPDVVLPGPTRTASLTPEPALPATPPEIALPDATQSQPEALAPETVPIPSKEPSLMTLVTS